MSIFIYFAIKTIHIELAANLTSQAFLNELEVTLPEVTLQTFIPIV